MTAPAPTRLKAAAKVMGAFAPSRNGLLQREAIYPSSFICHASEVPPNVHKVLRSPGQPLDPANPAFTEPRFSHDFSQVGTHVNRAARAPALLAVGASYEALEQEANELAGKVMSMAEPSRLESALSGARTRLDPTERRAADGGTPEIEANRTAEIAQDGRGQRYSPPQQYREPAATSGMTGLGGGRPMTAQLRRGFEDAIGWDFSEVRLHTGPTAAEMATRLGARAFAVGHDVVFGRKVTDPEASEHRRLLAHELVHVVQQARGAAAGISSVDPSLSSATPAGVLAAPIVTNVATSAAELGVGGNDITATATVAGARPNLTWSINPGAAPPAGVSVIGTGRRVRIHAAQPPAGAVVGGNPIVVRAAVTGAAGDFFEAPPVMLAQVVSATYANNPALANVPSLVLGNFPPNTAEPNRDGIAGNTAVVNAVTAPAGRPTNVAFRRSLGAAIAGNVITPGRTTGNMRLRITDATTGARLNEAAPATVVGGAPLMAELAINPVPLRVRRLANAGGLANPYGFQSAITFARSDPTANPLSRIVGEQVTLISDQLGRPPVNGAFNPGPNLALAVPANNWTDQIGAVALTQVPGTTMVSIDVNRFVGPGVPQLPRAVVLRQEFIYFSWQGGGAVSSNVFDRGRQKKTLLERGRNNFRFLTEHIFPGATLTPIGNEAYVGPALIALTNAVANPTAAGATGLAADGAATANLAVNSNVAGRTVNWSILSGDMAITAGNPAVLPATATLRAGVRTGNFQVRAADSIFPNRRVDGRVRVVRVRLRNLRATPSRVPTGTATSNVTVNADPGGRTLNWTVDASAAAAGVTVAPVATGPGLAMNVTVTRPPAFRGSVTVTATDSVLAARTGTVRIQFL
jgi:hypothetical protein